MSHTRAAHCWSLQQVPQLCSRILDDPVFERSINMKGFFIGNPGINSDVSSTLPFVFARSNEAYGMQPLLGAPSLTQRYDKCCCSGITM